MEVNKDKLIEVLSKIEDRLSKIERYLSTNQDKNTNQDSSTKKDNKFIYKNTIDFELLIDAISDTNSKNIVNQIYLNKYPTITLGQYNLIKNIAGGLNSNVDL